MRHVVLLLALVSGLWLTGAATAAADPPGPTNYRSTVTAVEAPGDQSPTVTAEVVGGDDFLMVRAAPGTRVVVPGYADEPYLRIDEDGTVERNERSPARWLNEARLGERDVDVPAQADPEAEPVWRRVADGGAYAWHDHRIHWMSPSAPAHVDVAADEPQPVMEWEVPLRVDDGEVVVRGELVWHPGPPAVVPAALVAVALAAGLALGLAGRVPAAVLSGVGGAAALAVGVPPALGLPPGAETDPTLLVLPVLAVLLAALGLGLGRRRPHAATGRLIGAASGLPLLVWAVLQAGALTRPIVPGPLPGGVVGAVTALALGLGAAALAFLGRDLLAAAPWSLEALSDAPDEPSASGR